MADLGRLGAVAALREAPGGGGLEDAADQLRARDQEAAPAGGARTLVDSVFSEDSGQVTMRVIQHRSPAEAALAESGRGYDLVIVGVGKDWGLGERMLGIGFHPEKLLTDSPTSLLVVRGPDQSPRRRLARATARSA